MKNRRVSGILKPFLRRTRDEVPLYYGLFKAIR